jgi:hypothetical protein
MDNLSTSNLPPSLESSVSAFQDPNSEFLSAWLSQQESLELQIGLSFPPEFNLLPR